MIHNLSGRLYSASFFLARALCTGLAWHVVILPIFTQALRCAAFLGFTQALAENKALFVENALFLCGFSCVFFGSVWLMSGARSRL